jgi:hypothetical protein
MEVSLRSFWLFVSDSPDPIEIRKKFDMADEVLKKNESQVIALKARQTAEKKEEKAKRARLANAKAVDDEPSAVEYDEEIANLSQIISSTAHKGSIAFLLG